MARILVVAWEGEEGQRMVEAFDEAGHEVEHALPKDAAVAQAKSSMPDVVCIDLGEQPGHGREVARSLSKTKATERIPLVIYGVDEEADPRTRTAAPRARILRERDPASVMATVGKVLGLRTSDVDDDAALEEVLSAAPPPRKPARKRVRAKG